MHPSAVHMYVVQSKRCASHRGMPGLPKRSTCVTARVWGEQPALPRRSSWLNGGCSGAEYDLPRPARLPRIWMAGHQIWRQIIVVRSIRVPPWSHGAGWRRPWSWTRQSNTCATGRIKYSIVLQAAYAKKHQQVASRHDKGSAGERPE
jgi:hypothetical protein